MGLFRHIATTTMIGLVVARTLGETTLRFGGENPLGLAPDEENWHHEGITTKAAESAGWTEEAGRSLAFHTDYVDSYLYNPLWWFDITSGGGLDRFAVALSTRAELEKLHFDDLFTPEEVNATWDRYLGGTVAGLAWIASSHHSDRLKVSLAHNLVGASLHAIQDFYSHSNWIDDPARREVTWFDVPEEKRPRMSLWTGSYEEEDHLGIKPHGDFLFGCTVVNNIGATGRSLLSLACHAASPLAGSNFCQMLRSCDKALVIDVPDDWRTVIPPPLRDDLIWVKPGINLDSRWLADVGVRERGLADLTGEQAFSIAYRLAVRTSCQWLRILDGTMAKANHADFWDEVMHVGVTEADYQSDTTIFEHMALVPYQFITAGPYPPDADAARREQHYLRLQISTADVLYAGTDADLVPYVNGIECPRLDHSKPAEVPEGEDWAEESLTDNILSIDDFERGSTATYILGPFDSAPRELALTNTAPDFGDLVLAALEALGEAIVDMLKGIRDFFRTLTGYDPDFVASDYETLDPVTLDAIPVGGERNVFLTCDGGSEGRYKISGTVERLDVPEQISEMGAALRTYRVRFTELYCHEESDFDRGTWSDEPFVLGLVIPRGGGGEMHKWRSEVFGDVDDEETRELDGSFVVTVPEAYGSISIAGAVYESDGESASERDELLDAFAGHLDHGLADPEEGFLIQLTEALGSSWRPGRIDAVAFTRDGRIPTMTPFTAIQPQDWLDGGAKMTWELDSRGTRELPIIIPDDLDCPSVARGPLVPHVPIVELARRVRMPVRRVTPWFDVSPATRSADDAAKGKPTLSARDEIYARIMRKERVGSDPEPTLERRKKRADIPLEDKPVIRRDLRKLNPGRRPTR